MRADRRLEWFEHKRGEGFTTDQRGRQSGSFVNTFQASKEFMSLESDMLKYAF